MAQGERSEQERVRFDKLARLRQGGFSFPNDVKDVVKSGAVLASPIEAPEGAKRFTVAGRIVQLRLMGKAAFTHILDGDGKLQLYVKKDAIGEAAYTAFKEFDIGDIVEARGYAFVTKTGEKSLHCESLRLLTKSLIPLPEKWHGLSDTEIRYRQRYVDLIANPEVREAFRKRSRIVSGIRRFLDDRGYLEVETPILQYVKGGAEARPFETHHNTLNADMILRIATELPLKKLVVGGFERVYEIGRIFRNEGISKKHNPEFTTIEFYQAYATYEDLMNLTEELFCELAQEICGTLKLKYGGHDIDLTRPWPRVSMQEALHRYGGVDRRYDLSTIDGLEAAAKAHSIILPEKEDWGRSLEHLWGELAEKNMINPVFLTNHPFSISPLARKNSANPQITDRFELIIAGMEMANAFSELNDAVDQRERFEAQAARKAAGNQEACEVDEDFLKAIEYGLPPTAGQGIGIDRLVMLLTNSPTIRDVILFPQLKPESESLRSGSEDAPQEAEK